MMTRTQLHRSQTTLRAESPSIFLDAKVGHFCIFLFRIQRSSFEVKDNSKTSLYVVKLPKIALNST